MPQGVILKGIGGFYYVSGSNGIYECRARGIFRKDEVTPLPGDIVEFSIISEAKKMGNVEQICPRKSLLVRPAVANVDQVIAVISMKSPEPDFLLLDKLLVTAEFKCLDTVICINKIDIDSEEQYKRVHDTYTSAGYKVILSSSITEIGLDSLKSVLNGRVSVFSGQSGVGKSTLMNRVMDSLVMKTGLMSLKSDRGKHTTRHAELVQLVSGGYIVDTPGFSSFEIQDMNSNELQSCYPEIAQYFGKCKFTYCSHISEPGCSVKEALKNGIIMQERYDRYVQLYSSLAQSKSFKDRNA